MRKLIQIQSISDIITNSSSELFLLNEVTDYYKDFEGIESYLCIDSEKALRDMFNYICFYWTSDLIDDHDDDFEICLIGDAIDWVIYKYGKDEAFKSFKYLLSKMFMGKTFIVVNNGYWNETVKPLMSDSRVYKHVQF